MALNPLKKKYHLEEVYSSSYQAISGGGKKLLEDYAKPDSYYRENAVPLIGTLKENGFTSEEIKGINEARKILDLPKLKVRSHTVRVPVYAGHGLTITLKAKEDFDMAALPALLASQSGVICDGKVYTAKDIAGKDEVYISRLRQDLEDKNIIHFWAVCDNLLKGAALNGSQIAELLLEKYL
jgi:aspartate-semialdehyde dehydrogenase